MKPILIGQAPPPPRKDGKPCIPLFPLPKNQAGGRLCTFLGLSRTQYLRAFDRVNLLQDFPGRSPDGRADLFPMPLARVAAAAIRPFLLDRPLVVLVGRGVATAFGHPRLAWFEEAVDVAGFRVMPIPHPSGRSREYNSEATRDQLRARLLRHVDPSLLTVAAPNDPLPAASQTAM